MSEKEDAAYTAWKAEVAKDFAADPEAAAAFEKLSGHSSTKDKWFRGTLRQDEFHRRLNEVSTEKQTLAEHKRMLEEEAVKVVDWYKSEAPKNEALLAYQRNLETKVAGLQNELLARGVDVSTLGGPAPARQPAASADEATMHKIAHMENTLNAMNNNLPAILSDMSQVSHAIVKEGWDVDPATVLQYAQQRGVRATDALVQLTQQQRQDRWNAEYQKRLDAAREEGKREFMASHTTSDYQRGAPRMGIQDMQKAVEMLGDRESRRNAAIAEASAAKEQLQAQGLL